MQIRNLAGDADAPRVNGAAPGSPGSTVRSVYKGSIARPSAVRWMSLSNGAPASSLSTSARHAVRSGVAMRNYMLRRY